MLIAEGKIHIAETSAFAEADRVLVGRPDEYHIAPLNAVYVSRYSVQALSALDPEDFGKVVCVSGSTMLAVRMMGVSRHVHILIRRQKIIYKKLCHISKYNK